MYFIAFIPVREDVVATDKLFRFKRVFKVAGAPHLVPYTRKEAANISIASCVPFLNQVCIPLEGDNITELHETMEMLYEVGSEISIQDMAELEASAKLGIAFEQFLQSTDDMLIELDPENEFDFLYDQKSKYIPGGDIPYHVNVTKVYFDGLTSAMRQSITAPGNQIQAADVLDTFILDLASGSEKVAAAIGAAYKVDAKIEDAKDTVVELVSEVSSRVNNYLLRKLLK